jgi:hypothetical protein
MVRQFLKSKRPLLSAARSHIELSATVAAMAVAVVVVPPKTAGRRVAVSGARSAATLGFSRLSSIPSHNGIYRASLIPSPADSREGSATAWTVEVRTANGAPVERATLALDSWMPDHERLGATPARVTGDMGDGRYRVEGLRLGRRGWWNVRLTVAAQTGTDSLAFNLVR